MADCDLPLLNDLPVRRQPSYIPQCAACNSRDPLGAFDESSALSNGMASYGARRQYSRESTPELSTAGMPDCGRKENGESENGNNHNGKVDQ